MYYGEILRYQPKDPYWPGRDRFVISKGHGSLCMYPILADLGYFDYAEVERMGSEDSILGTIPDPAVPGYETINGSLGQPVRDTHVDGATLLPPTAFHGLPHPSLTPPPNSCLPPHQVIDLSMAGTLSRVSCAVVGVLLAENK